MIREIHTGSDSGTSEAVAGRSVGEDGGEGGIVRVLSRSEGFRERSREIAYDPFSFD